MCVDNGGSHFYFEFGSEFGNGFITNEFEGAWVFFF